MLLGTSVGCDIRMVDRSISRRHAALEARGPRLEYIDLGSTNGTFANEVAIIQAHLWGDERLRLGDTTFLVETAGALPSAPVADVGQWGRVIGSSLEMRRLFPVLEQLARADSALVIEGESGTGKELLAETLHEQGSRADRRMIVLDARIPPERVEIELQECFEQADGGTLVIDEVGELDAAAQKLLVAWLERREREGMEKRVRLIATTQIDLDRRVFEGSFRDDLYHRLFASRIEVPPLSRRRSDVAVLAKHFWKELGGTGELGPTNVAELERLPLLGNVRELKHRVARIVAGIDTAPSGRAERAGDSTADPADDLVQSVLDLDLPLSSARERVIAGFEVRYVERVLAQHNGNVTRAARASGLARRYFQHIRAKRGHQR